LSPQLARRLYLPYIFIFLFKYKETKFAKTAKVPMKFIQKKFRSDLRGFVKEAIEQLAKEGYVILMKRLTEYVLIWTGKGISATKKILERK
ncbi:hypothetical protein C5S32_00385, partial [ANME-1 cluster archaeon GoMg1]|nr:hypothetical protein [ANME-1 cluster archaeon GoMg1]